MIPINKWKRGEHLEEFIKDINPKALQEYGRQQLPKSYMTNYGYTETDRASLGDHNQKQVRNIIIPQKGSNKRRRAK